MKLKSLALKVSLVIMMAVGFYACSSSDHDGLYSYLSGDKMMYASANLHDLMDNAGFDITPDGVKPSEAFVKLAGDSSGDMLKQLNIRGINLDKVVAMFDMENGNGDGIMVFKIDDKEKFSSYMSDNDVTATEEDGMQVYPIKGGASMIIVDGDYGLLVDKTDTPAKMVDALKKAAAKNPLKSWQRDALAANSTIAMVMDIKTLYEQMQKSEGAGVLPSLATMGYPEGKEAYGVLTSSLSGLEWKGDYRLCDADGKDLKLDIEYYPLAKSLLEYADSKDRAVAFFAAPKDFDYTSMLKTLGDGRMASQINSVLQSIRSVMLAGGPVDITEFDNGAGWTGVLAAQLAPGAAAEYLNMIKLFVSQLRLPVEKSENSITITGFNGLNALARVDGDNLVISVNTQADAGKCSIKASDFGSVGGVTINIPSNTPSVTFVTMPFGVNFNIKSDGSAGAQSSLKLTDTKGTLLENIIEFAASRQ